MLDCYSIKPIDAAAIRQAAADTGALITVEDHWPEGGLGDAVLAALAEDAGHARVVKLAVVTAIPGSGTRPSSSVGRASTPTRSPPRRTG